MAWGNENAASADLNRQPRPVAVSSMSSHILYWTRGTNVFPQNTFKNNVVREYLECSTTLFVSKGALGVTRNGGAKKVGESC